MRDKARTKTHDLKMDCAGLDLEMSDAQVNHVLTQLSRTNDGAPPIYQATLAHTHTGERAI